MMGEHERGPTSDQRAPAELPLLVRGDGPSRAGTAVARAQGLAARAAAAVATARDVLDGSDAARRGDLAAARAELGDAAGVLAARLRRDGAPPERMLVLVKDAARAATPPGADPPAARDLMAHAVRRGIEAYFAA